MRKAVLVGVVLAVAMSGCTATPPPTPPDKGTERGEENSERPAVEIPPVFAYSVDGEVRVVNMGTTVPDVALGAGVDVSDAEWTADGARLVVSTSARLLSIDTATGDVEGVDCECDSVAVVGNTVYTTEFYGDTELSAYTLPELSPTDSVVPELAGERGLLAIDGAGDRVVMFEITQDGARPVTDVVVLDPRTGETTTVGTTGEVGVPYGGAYTPRGWQGRPVYAYLAQASNGASRGVGSVVWFDPESGRRQRVLNDRHLRVETPPFLEERHFNSGYEHLWWAADGSLNTAAHTWSCADSEECSDLLPHQQWRYDRAGWTRTDDRDLASVRTLSDGTSVELSTDNELTIVDDGKRVTIDHGVTKLWTPALPGPPVERGDPEVAERLAPQVRLHPEEKNFPGDAGEFVERSRLLFYHKGVCQESVAEQVDAEALALGEYRNPSDAGRCGYNTVGKVYRSDEWATEDGGVLGFVLDLADEARPGHEPVDGVVSAPVYWQYVSGDAGKGAYVYWLFYPYNDFNNNHEADWEKIAVQVEEGEPRGVVFWKHNVPACRVPWDALGNVDGHPVTYAAKGSHGSYPTPGDFAVYDFKQQFGTDRTSDDGARWPTWRDVRETSAERWYGYRGLWGDVLPVDVPVVGDKFQGIGGPNPARDLPDAFTTESCELRAVPKKMVGTWKSNGQVRDPIGGAYTMTVTITSGSRGDTIATATFDGLGCTGTWKLTGGSSASLVVRENRDGDPRCATAGNAVIVQTPTGLSYSYQPDRRPGPATAELIPS